MIFSENRFTLFRIMLWRRKSGCAAAANSRATMPWGRLRGAAPGYPAAAARPSQSSSNREETLTNSRPSDGQLAALSGTSVFRNRCCAGTSHEASDEASNKFGRYKAGRIGVEWKAGQRLRL